MKKILFCGFGKLGKDCMKKLIDEGYNICYILTHKELDEESVDTFAINNKIDYSYEDTRKNKEDFQKKIVHEKLKYLVSVNYRYVIPKEIFSIPKYALNIHGALLPKYRGRTPHVWSIINGEEYSGITCHLIDEGVDTGNIIEQVTIKIDENDTGFALLKKFQVLYPNLLIKSMQKLENDIQTVVQSQDQASYYGKRTPDMGYIDFYKSKKQIINFVRAQAYPYPGAYYYLNNGKMVVINKLISVDNDDIIINTIGVMKLVGNNYYVKCLDGILKLIEFEIKS
jgi:methionyl-tRNA formyltransferase